MKNLLLVIVLGLSLGIKAQIVSELSFEDKTKSISLSLKNEYDELVALYPPQGGDDKKGTYFIVNYRDSTDKVLYSFSTYVFEENRGFRVLLPKNKQTYILDLTTKRIPKSTYSVEIKVHIEVRNSRKTLFIDDITQTYKWK